MVFAAAFVAGAAAAVGVNSVLDVRRMQSKPLVESEPIFVALRSLPQGSPVTVWDVGLKSWPKAMLPATAIRAEDAFEGCVLRHPLREGQPLLSVQLVRPDAPAFPAGEPDPFDIGAAAAASSVASGQPNTADADLWTPAASTPRAAPRPPTSTDVAPVAPVVREPAGTGDMAERRGAAADASSGQPTPASTPTVAGPAAVEPAAKPETGDVVDAPVHTPADPPAAATGDTPVPPPADATTVVDRQRVPDATVVSSENAPPRADPAPNEPTLADIPEPGPALAVEQQLVSVMKPPAVQSTQPPAGAPSPPDAGEPARATEPRGPGPDGIVRYLVVPERIAHEADSLFVGTASRPNPSGRPDPSEPTERQAGEAAAPTPPPPALRSVADNQQPQTPRQTNRPPAVAPVQSTAPRTAVQTPPAMVPAAPAMQPQRPDRQPVAGRPKPAPRQSRAPQRQPTPPARRGSTDTPRPSLAAPRTAQAKAPTQSEKPNRFSSVMSSITSGFEALVGGGRKSPTRPSDYDEAIATDEPQILPAPLPR